MRTIYREQILKALLTEPLQGGQWVEKEYLHEIGDCRVCAVGAILRSCLKMTNSEIHENGARVTNNRCVRNGLYDNINYPKNELKKKNYLGALSIFFEDLVYRRNDGATPNDRVKLCKFVLDNFPSRITVNI